MSAAPLVTVIVPVRGDSRALGALLTQLPAREGVEVVVASTGPVDVAQAALRAARPDVRWLDALPGRGVLRSVTGRNGRAAAPRRMS